MSTDEKYTQAEVTEARQFHEFFIDLFENHRDNLVFYLASTAILDWFGHTIKGPKNIVTYLKNSAGTCKHDLTNAKPARKIGFKDNHVVKFSSNSKQCKSSISPLTNEEEVTPPNLTFSPVFQTRIVEKGQGDGPHNCEASESPRKKCKMDLAQGDGAEPMPTIKYIISEGHIQFRRKSSKKLQTETKWNRPCKLEVAYSATNFEDCVIYMIIYQGHKNDTYNGGSLFHEMSDQEIECVVLTAQSEAIEICNKMGIKECNTFAMNILPVDLDSLNCVESLDCMSKNSMTVILRSDIGTILTDYDLGETDLETDCQLEESISFSETLNLKDYSHDNKGKDIDFVNGPFLKVLLENGSTKTIKKTSLCWLFSKNSAKLSSDRLTRFTSKQVNK
ncbi:hypothetical protein FQR65_LT07548 [Abscondita terminalis]|nr:hypothetical protein FQR65_LT07548 [Abscondita terminalis]